MLNPKNIYGMNKPAFKHKKRVEDLMGIAAFIVVAVSFAPIDFGWKLLGYMPYVIGSVILAWHGFRQRCWIYASLVTFAALVLTVGQASVMYHWLPL